MSAKIPINTADSTPKPSKGTVYIDVDDDITAIIEKVELAKAKVVALVLPKRATALQSVVNMRLLKRAADNTEKNIVLVSAEASLLPLAGAAGLHVAKSLQAKPEIPASPVAAAAEKSSEVPITQDGESVGEDEDEIDTKNAKLDYHRSIGELAAGTAVEDEAIALDDEDDAQDDSSSISPKVAKTPKSKKIKVPNFDRFRALVMAGAVLLIGLIVFIILAIFVLPKAKITVNTTSTPVSVNMTLDASDKYKTLNETANQIPAVLKTTKQTSSQQVQATGQQNNGTKAVGTVTLSTEPCSHAPTVSGGTGVTSSGLTFTTAKTVTLSNTSFDSSTGNTVCSGNVDVTAQQGGTKYNLPANSSFSVQGYSGITGTNSSKFTGGNDNITVVVSQADVDNAKQKATSSAAADTFTKQYEQQLTDQGNYVLTSTLKASDQQTTATPAVGQPASTVNVSVVTTYTVLTIAKSDLQKAITDEFNNQIDKNKQKVNTDDVVKSASVSVQSQGSTSSASIVVSEDSTAVPILSADQVKKIAAGKKAGDIKTALSGWPGVKSVNVDLSPFWLSSTPSKTSKITVTFVRVKD